MLREFQAEIERLKAQLAERRGGSGAATPAAAAGKAGAAPATAGISSGSGGSAAAGSAPGGGGNGGAAMDARAAAIRQSVRAELERQLRQAASVEALARARQAVEQQAR